MGAGGKREGSGRKTVLPEDKRVQMIISINPDTKRKLKSITEAKGIRVGRVIDELIKNYEL